MSRLSIPARRGKFRSFGILAVIISLLASSCTTVTVTRKLEFPEDKKLESIQGQLDIEEAVYARIKRSSDPIMITGFVSDTELSGIYPDGTDVVFSADQIEEVWEQIPYTVNLNKKAGCSGCGPLLWVVFSLATENVIAGFALALGVSYAIVYISAGAPEDDEGIFKAE